MPTPADAYAFDNDDLEAADRHDYLAAILDPFTVARLSSVGDLAGRRCLELGAGGGSVARWLADRVGPDGRVLATDLNPRHIPPHPRYTVLRHDLVAEPVPDGPWDLIHARLVLRHLKPRDEILRRLVAALAPGGALVVDEWDGTVGDFVLAAPDPEAAALLERIQLVTNQLLAARGVDPAWGRKLHATMLAEGLVEVDTEVHARAWPGGSAGALLLVLTVAQLHDEFLAAGLTRAELDQVRRLARDPRVVWRGLMTYSTIGRRPATAR
jgi:SAM-dependent methyltransferase